METLKSTKVDWKKITVVGALAVLTATASGLAVWYYMDQQVQTQAEYYEAQLDKQNLKTNPSINIAEKSNAESIDCKGKYNNEKYGISFDCPNGYTYNTTDYTNLEELLAQGFDNTALYKEGSEEMMFAFGMNKKEIDSVFWTELNIYETDKTRDEWFTEEKKSIEQKQQYEGIEIQGNVSNTQDISVSGSEGKLFKVTGYPYSYYRYGVIKNGKLYYWSLYPTGPISIDKEDSDALAARDRFIGIVKSFEIK